MTTPQVAIGQVWKDCDKRSFNRHLIVRRIEGEYAYCEDCYEDGRAFLSCTPPLHRIKLSRFRPTSTGYRLVKEAK